MGRALNRALGIFELLERILLELPMVDILLVQRVCRRWKAVIQDSLPLQRALFLAPLDPLRFDSDEFSYQLTFNPLLQSRGFFPSWASLNVAFRIPRAVDPNASWRRMYLTQPPSTGCQLYRPTWYVAGTLEHLDCMKGMTAGDLTTKLEEINWICDDDKKGQPRRGFLRLHS